MPESALEFLDTQRVGVFAVRMPDGAPHGAAVHFAYIADPLTFIFLSSPTYRKLEPLRRGESPASFVVGASEEVMKTLQIDGMAKLDDTEEIRNAYFAKFPGKLGKHPADIFFTFTPTWWRYTDWTAPEGKTIYPSDGSVSVKPRT